MQVVAIGVENVDLACTQLRHGPDPVGYFLCAKSSEKIVQSRGSEGEVLDGGIAGSGLGRHPDQVYHGFLVAVQPGTGKREPHRGRRRRP